MNDILPIIFSNLDINSAGRAFLVCKSWNRAIAYIDWTKCILDFNDILCSGEHVYIDTSDLYGFIYNITEVRVYRCIYGIESVVANAREFAIIQLNNPKYPLKIRHIENSDNSTYLYFKSAIGESAHTIDKYANLYAIHTNNRDYIQSPLLNRYFNKKIIDWRYKELLKLTRKRYIHNYVSLATYEIHIDDKLYELVMLPKFGYINVYGLYLIRNNFNTISLLNLVSMQEKQYTIHDEICNAICTYSGVIYIHTRCDKLYRIQNNVVERIYINLFKPIN